MVFLTSCGLDEPKFVRKDITNNDIRIKWYYYSRITNNSPDFVVVEKEGQKKEIYEAVDVVTDVFIKDKTIVIKLYKPERGIVHTKQVGKNLFGYEIILDSTATYDEYRFQPNGKKENNSLFN